MAFVVTPLLCPFTVALDIFMLKKDIAKTHCNNVELNTPDNAPMAIYHVALVGHWLVMGLKTNNSFIDARVSKMEVAIENIVSLTTSGNLAVNQLMEREAATVVTAKVASTKELKWAMMMAKNVR